MVKLYSLNILHKSELSAHWLKTSYELSAFSFFQKASVKEFMAFISKTMVERTQLAARQSVKEGEYVGHVFVRADGLAGVLISDHEYPMRVAHTLLSQVLDDFSTQVPPNQWGKQESEITYDKLLAYLTKYQNPREADAMTQIHADLEETRIIMHNTIAEVLKRGEKIDDLVAKSNDLTLQSKAFYKTARKTNSCCNF